jgi:hypothetical protein
MECGSHAAAFLALRVSLHRVFFARESAFLCDEAGEVEESKFGGAGRNRTADKGFADLVKHSEMHACLAI